MGKINQGILDGFSGKVGTVVGYKVHGKKVMRAYVDKVKDPRTAKQMDARLRFKTLAALAVGFLTASKTGLERIAASWRHTVANAFMRINQGAVTVADGVAEVDLSALVCSVGALPQVGFGQADYTEPLTAKVDFAPNSDTPGAADEDEVYLFVYEPSSGQGMLSAPAQRSTGTVEVNLPSTWSGVEVHVYGFALGKGRDNDGKHSNSAYIGSGIVG